MLAVWLADRTNGRGGFNGRPLVQWPTGPQASDVIGALVVGQQNDALTAEKHSNLWLSFYKA